MADKNIKKIVCGGLAFTDKEDMETLRQYAKEGWIFKEFKGLRYYLYKEDPKDIIYDYDMIELKSEEEEEYLQIFEGQGWHHIPGSKMSQGIYFFWAKEGTPRVHTNPEIAADRYRPIAKQCIFGLAIGVVLIAIGWYIKHEIWSLVLGGLGGAICGPCILMILASLFRQYGKRLRIYFRFKTAMLWFVINSIVFGGSVAIMLWKEQSTKILTMFALMSGALAFVFLFYAIMQYPQYKDNKEIK